MGNRQKRQKSAAQPQASITTIEQQQTSNGLKLSGKLNGFDVSYDKIMNGYHAHYETPKPLSELVRSQSKRHEFEVLQAWTKPKARIKEFLQMDIYSDIHPFEETAIYVGHPEDRPQDRYINANRITSIFGEALEDNLFIAAQGPIRASLRNFWKMVHQEHVGVIVTLVHQIPGDCDQYFPTELGTRAKYGEMQLTLILEMEDGFVHKRKFELVDTKTRESRTLMHYHFTGWMDWQLPEGGSRDNLAKMISEAADWVTTNHSKSSGKGRQRLLVHCRAGIGRTGTTLTLINAMIAIKQQAKEGVSDPQLSVFSIVRRLREQRIWMVQTRDQYEYIYDFLETNGANSV